MPILFLFLIFPVFFTVSNIFLFFTPTSYWNKDSVYFTNKVEEYTGVYLPSLTIQIPLYDEDFKKVLRPTLRDCVLAHNKYNEMGGKCNIIVNDDGIFKILKDRLNHLEYNELVIERVKYYKKYNIAFTARKYSDRPGKFKKAGNMNYGQQLYIDGFVGSPINNIKNLYTPSAKTRIIYFQAFEKKEEKKVQQIKELVIDIEDDNKLFIEIITPKHKPYMFKDVIIDREKRHMYYGDLAMGVDHI
jgi:hypothetical protein